MNKKSLYKSKIKEMGLNIYDFCTTLHRSLKKVKYYGVCRIEKNIIVNMKTRKESSENFSFHK